MHARVATVAIGSLLATAPAGAQLPAWTRGATCYEVFVHSFQDSDGDGIGDLNGLIARLDYINDGDPGRTRALAPSSGASSALASPRLSS